MKAAFFTEVYEISKTTLLLKKKSYIPITIYSYKIIWQSSLRNF